MSCGLSAVRYKSSPEPGFAADYMLEHLNVLAAAQNNRGDQAYGAGFYSEGSEGLENWKEEELPDLWEEVEAEVAESPESGITHSRYATSGDDLVCNAQPLHFDEGEEILVAHNGNISNSEELSREFDVENNGIDTEVIGKLLSDIGDPVESLKFLEEEAVGSYNLLVMDTEGDIYAYRDSKGQHPLWYVDGEDTMFAMSEDFAAEAIGRPDPGEVEPGQMVRLGDELEVERVVESNRQFCPFEVYYFENPGSSFETRDGDRKRVKEWRYEMGRVMGDGEPLDDALCVPILSSGKYFAKGYAESSGLEYEEAIIRNRDGRIYMQPGDRGEGSENRQAKAAMKHVPLSNLVEDEELILIEDSIVRGDTSTAITENLRDFNACEVHWRVMFPKITKPCLDGLDHSDAGRLIARNEDGGVRSEDEIAREIGADSVTYGDQELFQQVTEESLEDLCFGCVGDVDKYPGGIPAEVEHRFEAA